MKKATMILLFVLGLGVLAYANTPALRSPCRCEKIVVEYKRHFRHVTIHRIDCPKVIEDDES